MQEFPDFHTAFHHILGNLLTVDNSVDGVLSSHSVGSKFGDVSRSTREILAHTFTITNPRNRILPCRNMDERYAIANFFWTMAGDSNPEAIIHYNPHGKAFLEDSELKCAIPERLANGLGGSQLEDAIRRLKLDPSSRRALVTFARPEDIYNDALDFPCPSTMQFLVRDNKLTAIVTMRSQSAYGVMPYDVYLFTLIQEAVAFELGIELGEYIHFSGSIHLYEDEVAKATNLMQCEHQSVEQMVRMTGTSPISDLSLLEAELQVRTTNSFDPTGSAYWDDLISTLQS